MKMKFQITRTSAWRRARAIERGEYVPDSVIALEISPADLPADVRARLVSDYGSYPRIVRWPRLSRSGQDDVSIALDDYAQIDADALSLDEFTAAYRAAWADAETAYNAWVAQRDAERSEFDAAVTAWLESIPDYPSPIPSFPDRPATMYWTDYRKARDAADTHPRVVAWTSAQKAAVEAEAEAVEARRQATLGAIVRRLGTPNQIGRWDAGVLAHREAIDLAVTEAAASLREAAGDRWLGHNAREAFVETDCDCDCDYDTADVSRLSADEWDALSPLRSHIPENAVVVYSRDSAMCSCRDEPLRGPVYAQIRWTTAEEIDVTAHVRLGAAV